MDGNLELLFRQYHAIIILLDKDNFKIKYQQQSKIFNINDTDLFDQVQKFFHSIKNI